MSSVFDVIQSAFSSSPSSSSSSFLSSSPATSKFLGGKPQQQQQQQHQSPPAAPSSSDPGMFHRETPATLERDLHLQTELLQAFVRASLLRHARCAFRAMVELASSPAAIGGAPLDESIPQVAHLLYSLEMLLCHGLMEKKAWFEDKKGLWSVLAGFAPLVHKSQYEVAKDFNLSISEFERVSNPAHKARAWIRKALMEKVFCDYVKIIALNEEYLRDHYEGFAAIRSEEFATFLGTLQGLNAVSFSFVFKGANFDLQLSDISKFIGVFRESEPDESVSLTFSPSLSPQSKHHPEASSPEPTSKEDVNGLKEALSKASEQTSYLEEVNRHLKATINSEEKRKLRDVAAFAETQKGWEQEREQFQNIVIELQERVRNAEEEVNKLRNVKQSQSKKMEEMAGELVALEHLTLELQSSNPPSRLPVSRTLTGSSSVAVELMVPAPSLEGLGGAENTREQVGEEEEEEEEEQQGQYGTNEDVGKEDEDE